jgi:abortive infection bacteriophage resistance protein
LLQYLNDSHGDEQLAIALYEWNNELGAALWQLISLVEVALRNSIDLKMCERAERLGASAHWIFDEGCEFGRRKNSTQHRDPYKAINAAIQRVEANKKTLSAQQIISETTLGFWQQLVSTKMRKLWPDLASAFPYAPSRDQKYVSELIKDFRTLRNRISHHHKLHRTTIERGESMICELAKAIDPDFEAWLHSISKVGQVLGAKPLLIVGRSRLR